MELPTWYSQHASSRKNAKGRIATIDTVRKDGLWKIMKNSGCLSKSITIVQQIHDCTMVKFLDDRDESEAFPVTNGVKQGCFLVPTLFRMYILGHTDWFLPWLPGRNTGQIQDWRRAVQPQAPEVCYKGERDRHETFCLLLTVWNGLLISRLWQHQPYQQHQKWSHVSACTWPNAIRILLKFVSE